MQRTRNERRLRRKSIMEGFHHAGRPVRGTLGHPRAGGGDFMNQVINAQRYGKGWRVEAVTPSGEHVVVFVCGSLHAAVEQAMQAEAELE